MSKKIIFLIVLATAILSCSKEKGIGPDANEREVEMNFLLPGAATRVATDEENEIHNLTLLVFDGSTDNATYLYSRYAWRKTAGGNTFSTTLKIGTGFTIYFAANVGDLLDDLDGKGIVEGTSTWAQVRQALILEDQISDIDTNGIPMWGMAEDQVIADRLNNHLGTIQLIRMVAAIDVIMLAGNFDMEEGYTVFAADMGYLPYDPGKMELKSDLWRATAPYSPLGFKTDVDLHRTVDENKNEIVNQFYVYDNSTSLTSAEGDNRPTKVVVKGIWKDGEGRSTYYPLSIRNKIAENTYEKKQVTRNNKYTIMVTNVNGDGYEDLVDAKDADDVNGGYDVIEWDDNEDGEIIIEGSKYFFRDRSSVTLPRNAGASVRINIRTNYELEDIEMKFKDDSQYIKTFDLDTHGRFNVKIVAASADSSYDYLLITAKLDYDAAATDNPAILNVVAGRIGFNIHIEQLDMSPNDWNNGGGWGVIVE